MSDEAPRSGGNNTLIISLGPDGVENTEDGRSSEDFAPPGDSSTPEGF